MLFDIHAHIIPGVDDGAKNVEEAKALLKMAKDNGIGAIVATPHFYAEKVSFQEYEAIIDKNYQLLLPETEGMPKVYKGYEVRYFRGISTSEYTRRLTLNGSEYMLVEFPYGENITDSMIRDIEDIYYNQRITPILAHLERYHKYHGFKKALNLIDDGIAMAHVNATSFNDSYKKAASTLLQEGYASVVATDMHSVDTRPPMLDSALSAIGKNLGKQTLLRLAENYERLHNDIILK